MPGVLEEIGLTRLQHYTVLRDWFKKISTKNWRAFLRASAEKRTGRAAIDSTGSDRDYLSQYYAQRAHYRGRSLKVPALVNRCSSVQRQTVQRRTPQIRSTSAHQASYIQPPSKREISVKSSAVYRSYGAESFKPVIRGNRTQIEDDPVRRSIPPSRRSSFGAIPLVVFEDSSTSCSVVTTRFRF